VYSSYVVTVVDWRKAKNGRWTPSLPQTATCVDGTNGCAGDLQHSGTRSRSCRYHEGIAADFDCQLSPSLTIAGALRGRSFEETIEILKEAAAVGEKNGCLGVAENVKFGQTTGLVRRKQGIALLSIPLDVLVANCRNCSSPQAAPR